MKKLTLLFASVLTLFTTWLHADVALDASSSILSSWNGGYVAQIMLTNTSSESVTSWTVNFSIQSGQTVNCLWNGNFTQSVQNITVTNPTGNGNLAPGQTVILGFETEDPQMLGAMISNLTASGSTGSLSGIPLNSSYAVPTIWATAFQANITLENPSSTATATWTAAFVLPQGYTLSAFTSNGNFSVQGQTVTVTNLASNGTIQPNGSTTFGAMIDMPQGGKPGINSLQAVGNGTIPTPPPAPPAPATPPPAPPAPATPPPSPPPAPPTAPPPPAPPSPPPVLGIEHACWYIDWTSWFTAPYVLPTTQTGILNTSVNTINVFVGALMLDSQGNPTLGGFGNLSSPTPAQLAPFAAYCHAQNPPLSVKVSIGGSGGMYDNCWDLLTSSNVQAFAQGIVAFCQTNGLDGVDFDYEEYASSAQETLVGTLIKNVKLLNPSLLTSLCTNAGFGPYSPWEAVVQTIFNAAMIAPGNCAVDRLYIMSYYDPIASEEGWITSWANWAIQNYGFTPARISAGIDDFDAHAYDPVALFDWAGTQGYSTGHWAFDPAHP